MRIAHILGIEIRLDLSVLIVFALVVYSLGIGTFPRWHPDWPMTLTWSVAFAAGLLFFASLLAHELSHSFVAKLRGIAVPRITLFIFGGVSELDREPDTPRTEFLIAIAGPAMSFAIGIAFTALGFALAGQPFKELPAEEMVSAASMLGPLPTLCLWLGPINIVLGLFNLVPGFPLDGGRVLRAALWGITGDVRRATHWAAASGQAFAWALMALGVLEAVRGALIGGVWLLLIGWFLNNAARNSYTQLLVQQALDTLVVRNLMRTRFEVVGPEVTLNDFTENYLLRSDQLAWPVVENGVALGIVTFEDVRVAHEASSNNPKLRDILRPIDQSLRSGLGGRDALKALADSDQDPLPVLDGRIVVGLLHRADIMRWLALHQLEHGKP